eukprot:COSAG05_NODE_214_length_13907_cov_28.992178_30_plen_376_part_01
MGVIRGMWREDFAIQPDIGHEYLCFCVASLLCVLSISLVGTIKTYDADETIFGAEQHIISGCGMVNVHNATGPGFSDGSWGDEEVCTPDTGIPPPPPVYSIIFIMDAPRIYMGHPSRICLTQTVPVAGTCVSVEKMVYSVVAFMLLSGTCCIITGLRFEPRPPHILAYPRGNQVEYFTLGLVIHRLEQWNKAAHPVFPPGITSAAVSLFIVHGLITFVTWMKCLGTGESQEQGWFMAMFVWSIVTVFGEAAFAILGKLPNGADCGTCMVVTFGAFLIVLSGIGVIATTMNDTQVLVLSWMPQSYLWGIPAGPGFTVKRPIRKEELAPLLRSRLILILLPSRIWRALHESVNFVHDPEKQYKSLSVAPRPGGLWGIE